MSLSDHVIAVELGTHYFLSSLGLPDDLPLPYGVHYTEIFGACKQSARDQRSYV